MRQNLIRPSFEDRHSGSFTGPPTLHWFCVWPWEILWHFGTGMVRGLVTSKLSIIGEGYFSPRSGANLR